MQEFKFPIKKEPISLKPNWDYFDGIFCINLDEREDRWNDCQEEFKKIGILDRVKRFSAIKHVDGGRTGCWLSHLSAIAIAKKRGYKNVFIWEDDISISNVFLDLFYDIISNLSCYEWELFYLGGFLSYPRPGSDPKGLGFGLCQSIFQIESNLAIATCLMATHAIAVNNSIYDKILNDCKNYINRVGIDTYYITEIQPNLKSFLSLPLLVDQKTGYSDIDQKDKKGDSLSHDFTKKLLKERLVDLR